MGPRNTRSPELSGSDLRAQVQQVITGFLAEHSATLSEISPDLDPLGAAIAELLRGGKRLRPAFCVWAYLGAGGQDLPAIVRVGASLEFVQACALIHDDVMDDSATRRGLPAAHERFAAEHAQAGWLGSPARFGAGGAILAGDLCLAWADELLYQSGFGPAELGRAKPVYDIMRTELMGGQFLDLLEQARGGGSVVRAERVLRYKSAKYTIERPLHIGAALADAPAEVFAGLSAFGLPVGEAFQLRDDLLGVFGDPELTGKPAGDDLREGKRTLLVAIATERATPSQAGLLNRGLGRDDLDGDDIAGLREVLTDTGAVEAVEELIAARARQAQEALAGMAITEGARVALAELAVAAISRSV